MAKKVRMVLNLTIVVETDVPVETEFSGTNDESAKAAIAAILDIWDKTPGADILETLDMMDKVDVSPVTVDKVEIL